MRTTVDDDIGGTAAGDDGTPTAASVTPATSGRRVPPWAGTAALVGVVVVGVVARFVQLSPLWLDEALSVNIATLDVGEIPDALRHDGHPPLYYLLLHYWMELVGTSDAAVRALSGVFSVAALPLAWIAGRRLAGRSGARWALAVTAVSPFVVRYGTETRMYSLVMLLVLGGYLLLTDALDRPAWPRLGGLAVISGLLLLTQYWAFYVLAAVGILLVGRAWRHPAARPDTIRVIVAVAAGGVLFLPWLGGFLYQSAHTGTPWGEPFRPTAVLQTTLADMGGGSVAEAGLYGSFVVLLVVAALLVVRSSGHEMLVDLRTSPLVRWEMAVAVGVLGIGAVVGYATSAAFQGRYASTVVPLVLVAVAVGLARIPGGARVVVGGAFLGLSLFGIGWSNHHLERTQSDEVGAAVAERAAPGDLVVYCPDQLGPGYSREMPDGLVELAYPTLDGPERVDWADYAERNEAADPEAIARDILDRADGHAVFVVWRGEYATFDEQCEELVTALGVSQRLVSSDAGNHFEPAILGLRPATGG